MESDREKHYGYGYSEHRSAFLQYKKNYECIIMLENGFHMRFFTSKDDLGT